MGWTLPSLTSTPSVPVPNPHPSASSEIDSIISVIKGFVSALNAKNSTEFEKYCVRAGGMSLGPPAPTTPRFCTIGAFVEHIAKLDDEIEERIWDPEVKVYGDGNLAAVWAPFRAKVNGVVNHVGVELFVLHKLNGRWKVTGLADSCRRPTEEEKILLF
ncbi:uncharacterized protein DSM5745_03554 [Aspergillus mulundensis]|uniref:SnoaL-like domain-containing protein n=1 Tax=Aspergillus mulundensis TaxID=1810919 RepID=A0A3D8SKX9_9EURO|nr:Uncharacterized protein DSM5745_03554 [Aspergillus mulundensis]RDW86912.1 Uncharacterized protein DSM5745_03554 [Aspergillus mulundensis]